MKRSMITVSLLLSVSVAGFAQKQYTLAACERMALDNNHKITNANLDIGVAAQTRKEAFTSYFPQVSATGTWLIGGRKAMRGKSKASKPGKPKATGKMLRN